MRQAARSLGRLWNEASPGFRGFIAVLSFFGIGKFVAEWFGGAVIIPYWGSLEKPALVAIGLSLGMVVGVWLRVRKGRVVEALRTQTYRHVITADVYREIGTIANSIVRRALDSPNWVAENWVGDKDVHNRLISLLERVKWLLGEKVYNIAIQVPCMRRLHLIMVVIIPPDRGERAPFSIADSTSGEAFTSKQTMIVDSILKDRLRKYKLSEAYRTRDDVPYRSIFCMPLLVGDPTKRLDERQVIGVFCLNSLSEHAFGPDDELLLAPIAQDMALVSYVLSRVAVNCSACL